MILEEKYALQKLEFVQNLSKILPFGDWNEKLIKDTEVDCNFDEGYSFILFPEGIDKIIDYFEGWLDQLMLEHLKNIEYNHLKIREKIALALAIRIKALVPKTIYQKNNSYFCRVQNAALGFKVAWRTCDRIWSFAGDSSTDFNYYTKRSLLFGVYTSSIIFYISDSSENSIKTDDFIIKALDNVINIAKFKNLCKFPNLEDIPILRLFS